MLVILVEYQFISSVPGAAWLQVSHSTNLRANTLITYFLHHQASPALSARPDWGSRSHQPGLARSGQWAELHNRPIWSHLVHLNIFSDKSALTGLAGLVESPNYEILVNTAVHWGVLQFLYRRHNVGQGQPGGPCLGQNTNILQRFDAQARPDQDRLTSKPWTTVSHQCLYWTSLSFRKLGYFPRFIPWKLLLYIVFHHWL